MCPDLPFAENGVFKNRKLVKEIFYCALKNRKLVKEIFYCALKNRKRLGRFVLRVLKNRKLVKEIFYCALTITKRLGRFVLRVLKIKKRFDFIALKSCRMSWNNLILCFKVLVLAWTRNELRTIVFLRVCFNIILGGSQT